MVILPDCEAGLELRGQLGEVVGGIAHDKPGFTVAGVTGGHSAGLAGSFVGADGSLSAMSIPDWASRLATVDSCWLKLRDSTVLAKSSTA